MGQMMKLYLFNNKIKIMPSKKNKCAGSGFNTLQQCNMWGKNNVSDFTACTLMNGSWYATECRCKGFGFSTMSQCDDAIKTSGAKSDLKRCVMFDGMWLPTKH